MSDFSIARASQRAGDAEVMVLELVGQLDAHTFKTLQGELDALEAEPARVVLDCGRLEYVSSAGLGVLKKMSRQFREGGGDIRLAALPAKIKNVISLLGFDQVIQVFPDRAAAVQSYAR